MVPGGSPPGRSLLQDPPQRPQSGSRSGPVQDDRVLRTSRGRHEAGGSECGGVTTVALPILGDANFTRKPPPNEPNRQPHQTTRDREPNGERDANSEPSGYARLVNQLSDFVLPYPLNYPERPKIFDRPPGHRASPCATATHPNKHTNRQSSFWCHNAKCRLTGPAIQRPMRPNVLPASCWHNKLPTEQGQTCRQDAGSTLHDANILSTRSARSFAVSTLFAWPPGCSVMPQPV